MVSMKIEGFEKLQELFKDTPAAETLEEMVTELGAERSWDLVVMLIVQADQIASMWQTEVQKGN